MARVEKEKIEERARTAERDHRLNILRSRANIERDKEKDLKEEDNNTEERFELFPKETAQTQNPKSTTNSTSHSNKRISKSGDDVLADHMKNDPIYQKSQLKRSSSKAPAKDYSFV